MQPEVRDLRPPDLMHPDNRDPAESVWVHAMRGMHLTQAWFGIEHRAPHRMHQPRYSFVIDMVALAVYPSGHPPYTIIRRVRILPIQQPHQREILRTLPT
jgi:hypothetical protein